MVLYIDETEHEEYFIVAGLLAESEQAINLAYKKFKKKATKHPLSIRDKQKIFLEFKSTLIDDRFQRIKRLLMSEISELDGTIIFSCYDKKNKNMRQALKESVYITLLSNIVNSIDGKIDIVFDAFNKKDFEELIVRVFSEFDNVESITPFDSQIKPGLQLADNICSVVRLHVTNQDKSNYYAIIKNQVKKV